MKHISHNQKRKKTYLKLSRGKQLSAGLYRSKFLRRHYWISNKQKAELVKTMSTDHLRSTILAVKQRHPETNVRPLQTELGKRMLALEKGLHE